MDISSVVIEQMRDRNADRDEMVWEVMDVWDMWYEDSFFDIAIDKSPIVHYPLSHARVPKYKKTKSS